MAAVAASVAAIAVGVTAQPAAGTPLSAPVSAPRLISVGYFGLNTPGIAAGMATTADAGPALPASTFGTVRYWDEARAISTIWCDVQPTPTTNLRASLAARLGPKLDAAKGSRAQRVVIVLGHAAPWVYGAPRGAGNTSVRAPWFCGGERSAVALPSQASIAPTGSVRRAWTQYVHAVIDYLEAKYPAGLPFEVAFQTSNEPNWLVSTTTGLPHTAVTATEAATSLATMDAVVRWVMSQHNTTVGSRLSLLTSPISSPGGAVAPAYLRLAESAQARSSRYNGFSLQTYSQVKPGETVTVSTLLTRYNTGAIARITAALASYPHLNELPRHQTETNHGLSVGAPGVSQLAEGPQSVLAARLAVDGLRWNLTSQSLYIINPDIMAVKVSLSPQGTLTGSAPVVGALNRVRGWLVGQLLLGCSVNDGVVDCTLRSPKTGHVSHVVYSDSGAPRTIVAPAGTTRQSTIWGGSVAVAPGQSVTLAGAPQLLS